MTPRNLALVFAVLMIAGLGSAALAGDAAPMPGQQVYLDTGCNGCHTVESHNLPLDGEPDPEDPAIDLSGVGDKYDAELLDGFLTKKAKIDDKKHKKRFKGEPAEREQLVAFLISLKSEPAEAGSD